MATKTGQTYVQSSTGMLIAITPTFPYVGIVPVNHGEKPEKFLRIVFKRWQKRMLSKGGEIKKYKFNGMCYICNKKDIRPTIAVTNVKAKEDQVRRLLNLKRPK